ncbi:MAG: VOC family protein [Bacteroidales bacterium]|nr:VOC family protein [Bacteroidales bacterium]
MCRIEHLTLYVSDLEREKAFFETYFNGTAGEKYHNGKTGFSSYFISFASGCRLELMNISGMEEASGRIRPGYIHMAMSVGSKDAVDLLTDRLSGDGYEVISNPRTTGDGYYESQIADPEGNIIEITV